MARRLLPFVLAAAVLATARPAAADGFYFLEGLGASKYGDQLREHAEGGLHFRVALGRRMGHVAVEAWVQPEFTVGDVSGSGRRGPYFGDLLTYGLDVKVLHPLSRHWSAYARAGLSRMLVDNADYAGRGVSATAGIQVAGKVPALGFLWWPLFFLAKDVGPKVQSGLWFEASESFYRLHGPGPTIDARLTGWSLGFSVGQDF